MSKKKLNNKGFAVSAMLYTLLTAFLLFLGASLAQFSSSAKILSNANKDLTDGFNIKVKLIDKVSNTEINTYNINDSDFPYNYNNLTLPNGLSISSVNSKLVCEGEFVFTDNPITYGTVKSTCKGASDVTLEYTVGLASVVSNKCNAEDSSYGVGTKITCGEEAFRVLKSEADKVVVIAEYSLKEQSDGSYKQGNNSDYTAVNFSSDTSNYYAAKGHYYGYWKVDYESYEDADGYYDDNCCDIIINEQKILEMINNYADYLKNFVGNNDIDSNLICKSDAVEFKNYSWFAGTGIPQFWSGTVRSNRHAYVIGNNSVSSFVYADVNTRGVRPIIYFPKSVIN